MNNFNHDKMYSKSLSEQGRRNLGILLSYFGLRSIDKEEQFDFQRDPFLDKKLEKVVKDSYKLSDECYSLFIPKSYIQNVKESCQETYLKFIKISTILMVEHLIFFEAFGIKPSHSAKKRSALFSFLKRTYDDLIDSGKNPYEVVVVAGTGRILQDTTEYRLLSHFKKLINSMAPHDKFNNFYNLLPKVHITQSMTIENASVKQLKEIAFQKSRNSFLVDSYIMINDLPKKLVEHRKTTAELFQLIDDMSDLKKDLKNKKLTYINQSSNPEKTLRKKYDETFQTMKKIEPQYKLYAYLMKYFMEKGIYLNLNQDY